MKHRSSPAVVGAFVLGAILLALGAITVLGSKDLFRETYPCVSFFHSSVNGLRKGAPVKFKGVEVGSVNQIRLPLRRQPDDPPIVVFFSLDAEKLRTAEDEELDEQELQQAVAAGLRVRLEQESFVTGLLFLSIVFVPGSEAKLHDPVEGVPEIPTAPTEFEELTGQFKRFVDRLEKVDLVALANDLQTTVESIGEIFESGQLQKVLLELDETLVSVNGAATVMRQEIGPLVESLRAAAERIDAVGSDLQVGVDEARQTLDRIDSLAGSLEGSARELTSSIDATLQAARAVIDPASPPVVQLERTLAELSATARSARAFLETLERDPAALVRGKGTPQEPR